MKAWWMQFGGAAPSSLELRDVPQPQPGPAQLLVKVHAAGLNRGEFLTGQPGAWKAAGGEGAGEVVKAGAEVRDFRAGDRVMGRCTGAFAEYAVMEAYEALPVPSTLSWEEAGALPMTAMVTFDMLVMQGRLAAGEWLLVNGVASGVGVSCLQLGKALGAKVIGTSRSARKLAVLQAQGLDVALTGSAFAADVLAATGERGADLVVNAVGGSVFAEGLRSLAYEGRMAVVGYVDRVVNAALDIETLHAKRLSVFGVSNKLRTPAQKAAQVSRFRAEAMLHVRTGKLRPLVDEVFGFGNLAAARDKLEADAHVGKIVLDMAR